MTNHKEITGTFLRERHAFQNDGGLSRVVIGEVRTADGAVETVKGPAMEGELIHGLPFRFWGTWTTHDTYGRQFAFQNFVIEKPIGRGAVITYLSTQFSGIGSAIASRIYDVFGELSLESLRMNPRAVSDSVKGLSADKAAAAAKQLRENAGTERATAELLDVIHGRGFPRATVAECLKRWGSKSAEVIRRNPYLLLRIRGCGFLKVDQIYCDLGLPAGTLKRQALCGYDAITRDRAGDTWRSVNVIRDALASKIAGAAPDPERAITLASRAGLIEVRHEADGRWVADAGHADAEQRLANCVAEMVTGYSAWPVVAGEIEEISEHQRNMLRRPIGSRLGVLAGRPGTGKTFVTSRLIGRILQVGYRVDQIAVAAPTGKAAQRLTESLRLADIPVEARTIHATLGVMATDGGRWFFQHDETNPLDVKFLFIDESSMLDVNLAASLFAAVGPETHVLLIGDVNQLPPVGHGAPLRDLIAAGVPCGELTEIRRNSGRIVTTCTEIVDKRSYTSSAKTNLDAGENLPHIESDDDQPVDVAGLIEVLARKYDVDPLSGVQVLVATNRLRKSLNQKLQEALNPTGRKSAGNVFRVGDKVINLKNGSFSVADVRGKAAESVAAQKTGDDVAVIADDVFADPSDGESLKASVANGEQGIVIEVAAGWMRVRLDSREIDVLVRWKRSRDESGSDDEDDGPGCAWDLAYAVSVHKSQGSEWPVVVVMLDPAGGRIQSRNWLYTAISRAKKLCVTVGPSRLLADAVRRDGAKRKTFLRELVTREMERIRNLELCETVQFETDWSSVLEGVA